MFVGYATVSLIEATGDTPVCALAEAGCKRVFTAVTKSMKITPCPGWHRALESLRQGDPFVTLPRMRLHLPRKDLLTFFVMLDTRGVFLQSLHEPIALLRRPNALAILHGAHCL